MIIPTYFLYSLMSVAAVDSCVDRGIVCQFGGRGEIAYTVRDEHERRFIVEKPGGRFAGWICTADSGACKASLVADEQGKYRLELLGLREKTVLVQYGSWGGSTTSIFKDYSSLAGADMEFLKKSYRQIRNLGGLHVNCRHDMVGLFVAQGRIAACDGNYWLKGHSWSGKKRHR